MVFFRFRKNYALEQLKPILMNFSWLSTRSLLTLRNELETTPSVLRISSSGPRVVLLVKWKLGLTANCCRLSGHQQPAKQLIRIAVMSRGKFRVFEKGGRAYKKAGPRPLAAITIFFAAELQLAVQQSQPCCCRSFHATENWFRSHKEWRMMKVMHSSSQCYRIESSALNGKKARKYMTRLNVRGRVACEARQW